MPIFTFTDNTFSKIDQTQFSDEGILERQNLQEAIKKDISIICEDCLVISEEFSEWSEGQRRIDLLAIDKNANLIVIELKRDDTGGHMELQSLRYAAMVSTMTYKQGLQIYKKFYENNNCELDAEESILSFLEWDQPNEESFASDVKIILISSNFSKELTTSVMWLNERDLDIRCVRLIPYKKNNEILVDIQRVIPLPEIENYQVKVRQKSEEIREARQSSRDLTKYIYNGEIYNKRKLVLAVILDWVEQNQPIDMSTLKNAFPMKTMKKLFVSYEQAKAVAKRDRKRHFIEEDEIISLSNDSQFAISNQWSKTRVDEFISIARELGIIIAMDE